MHRGSGPDFPGFSQKEIDELFLDSSEDKNETLKELKVTINLNDDDHKEILAMTKTAKKTKNVDQINSGYESQIVIDFSKYS